MWSKLQLNKNLKQEEIERLVEDELQCGALNAYLSLPSFPCSLRFDRKLQTFVELARYERKCYDKVCQPIFRCSICDLSVSHSQRFVSKTFTGLCSLIELAPFYQSTIYFSFLFIKSVNTFIDKKFECWDNCAQFFGDLKKCKGFYEYLCWIDLYKCSSKHSLQDIRLKYFRPNQINHISSISFTEDKNRLMESLIKNVALYWFPRLRSYSASNEDLYLIDDFTYQKISLPYLKSCDADELLRLLVSTISYEDLSGHVFQNFLLINKFFHQSQYLTFIKNCLIFYDAFSYDTVDSLWATRSAWKIISEYLMPSSQTCVYIPPKMLESILNSSNPPYDDLFDEAIEYALFILTPCVHKYFHDYLEDYEAISEESIEGSTIGEDPANEVEEKEEPEKQEPSLLSSDESDDDIPHKHSNNEPKPSENLLSDILRSRSEYERFKMFLASLAPPEDQTVQQINPLLDLECYIDIEKFKMAKGKAAARDELASNIKLVYMTKKYFFSPASPASREVQIKILGGSGHKMPPRPPSPTLVEVQAHVLHRLANKWVKQYRSTEDYQRRHDQSGSSLNNRRSKNNDNSQSFVFVDSKARANAHDMLQLRKTLLDPSKAEPLKRFAKAKNERLHRDIEFWIEVQKYKDMQHRHSSTSLIRKKIDTIIDCFLDSTVFPKVQVSVPNDIAHKITEARYDLGPYIFRQAQSIVTKVLCNLWTEFNTWSSKYSDEPLPIAFNKLEIESQQKRLVKQMLRQKQREDEKERAFIETNTKSSTKRRLSRLTSVASSTNSDKTVKPVIEKIEEFLPTLHWRFSETVEPEIGDKEKRNQFLLKDILDKGMFKDDKEFRNYLTDKITPRKQATQLCYNPIPPKLSKGTSSTKNSFDSSGSSKSYISRSMSRSNFDRTQLVSISERLTVPARKLNRRTAISINRKRPDSADTSSMSVMSGHSSFSSFR